MALSDDECSRFCLLPFNRVTANEGQVNGKRAIAFIRLSFIQLCLRFSAPDGCVGVQETQTQVESQVLGAWCLVETHRNASRQLAFKTRVQIAGS